MEDLWLPGPPGLDDIELAVTQAVPVQRGPGHIGCPLSWYKKAYAASRGKNDLTVALFLYRWHSVRKSRTLPTPNAELAELGVDRAAKWRALARLEKAGLVKIRRRGFHALEVTLVSVR